MRKFSKAFHGPRQSGAVSCFLPGYPAWLIQWSRRTCHEAVNSKHYQFAANNLLQNLLARI